MDKYLPPSSNQNSGTDSVHLFFTIHALTENSLRLCVERCEEHPQKQQKTAAGLILYQLKVTRMTITPVKTGRHTVLACCLCVFMNMHLYIYM